MRRQGIHHNSIYAIPDQTTQEDIYTLFDDLEGKTSIEAALPLCKQQHSMLADYSKAQPLGNLVLTG